MSKNEFVPGERYVRLTAKINGKLRTVWAERAGKNSFWVVNRASERPDPEELIVGPASDFTLRPAVMSRHYGHLFVEGDPEYKP